MTTTDARPIDYAGHIPAETVAAPPFDDWPPEYQPDEGEWDGYIDHLIAQADETEFASLAMTYLPADVQPPF